MTAEAGLLGVPTISCYPREPTIVEKYLIRRRLVSRVTDPEKAAGKIIQILNNFENVHRIHRERAKQVVSQMEDPLDVILNSIEGEYPPIPLSS